MVMPGWLYLNRKSSKRPELKIWLKRRWRRSFNEAKNPNNILYNLYMPKRTRTKRRNRTKKIRGGNGNWFGMFKKSVPHSAESVQSALSIESDAKPSLLSRQYDRFKNYIHTRALEKRARREEQSRRAMAPMPRENSVTRDVNEFLRQLNDAERKARKAAAAQKAARLAPETAAAQRTQHYSGSDGQDYSRSTAPFVPYPRRPD
jgi:hypothetical protein